MFYFSKYKRVVLKVGSALIAPDGKGCSPHKLFAAAQFIIQCRSQGMDVVLVSSGSIAAGRRHFDKSFGSEVVVKKAMAAAGQAEMVATWDKLFDFPTCQILLTHGDLRDPERYQSVADTIDAALANGLLPIVNENDAITTYDLKVGDNDNLAAMVSAAIKADILILCTDVDGLYSSNPKENVNATMIKDVTSIDAQVQHLNLSSTNSVGTGGMATKVEAAEKATAHGITTLVLHGEKQQAFSALLQNENPGTIFHPVKQPMQAQAHWLRYTTGAQGELVVNKTGEKTVINGEPGISSEQLLKVKGEFNSGDTVVIKSEEGKSLAKAITNCSSCLMTYLTEQKGATALAPIDSVLENDRVALLRS